MSDDISNVSITFSEGRGDLAIRSSDGIVCYFPKLILSRTSVVFQDMFDIGGNTSDTSSQTLQLTEPIVTLELFLTHLDPNILTPFIDPATIEGSMSMAHKYQANVIMDWFEREMSIERRAKERPEKMESFLSAHPILALSISIQANLQHAGKLALAETLECQADLLNDETSSLPKGVYLTINKCREARAKRYTEWVQSLASHMVYGSSACTSCPSRKATWVLGMAKAIQNSPSWSSFIKAYHSGGSCCVSWSQTFQYNLQNWEPVALEAENILPPGII